MAPPASPRKRRNPAISQFPKSYHYRGYTLRFSQPLIMGVLNVTPDSFSDGGLYMEKGKALCRVGDMIVDGADVIDVGGESTRPGAEPVCLDDEIKRVIPVIGEIVKQHPKIPVSIDSRKHDVVDLAMENGAAMINDIAGLRDKKMADVVSKWGAPVVITHMRGTPETMQKRPVYKNVVEEIITFFKERINFCLKQGIDKIILDPGIGFGKTAAHNLMIINQLEKMTRIGYPVMIGHSRKSFIGKILNSSTERREEATVALTAMVVAKGASIVRVHNVSANRKAALIARSVRMSG